ncbi:MAG: (d)CMP kinase [Angustibacter sp.]
MPSPDLSQPPLVIAVDGPSGSGKSSVSRAIAVRFGLDYLDTGAMYRALTWWCLERGVDLGDERAVVVQLDQLVVRMGTDPAAPTVHVSPAPEVVSGSGSDPAVAAESLGRPTEVDVTTAVRAGRISKQVSAVATNLAVRDRMRRLQQGLVARSTRGIVVEGRDITTVIAPDAPVRVLLTASEQARLERRARQVHGAADAVALAAVHDQVVRRDAQDATVAAFHEAADGVVTVDSSALDQEAVVEAITALVGHRTGRRPAKASRACT